MNYFLARRAALKWLETPSVYHIAKDELYELDDESFRFFRQCSSSSGCGSKDSAFTDYCLEEGLLATERTILQHPVLSQSPVPSLRYLELQITDSCNIRCKHCYIDNEARHELSPDRIRNILREFEALQGLRVLITGGEPLVHRDFKSINEMLPEYNSLRKVLFTNGLLLTKDVVRSLKVDEIQVSIDGLEAAHDALRGAGMFRRSLESMNLALTAGLDVSVSTMVHPANLRDFDEMEGLFKSMGVKDWTVDIPCSAGRLRENPEFRIDPIEGGKYLGYGYGGGLHASSPGYACGLHLLSVLADGTVAKCTFYHDQPLGTVDEGLGAAWSKLEPVRLDELTCDCEYIDICRGGCRYRAELLEGKRGKDRYRCVLYGIL